jgi:hypothetical protein
MNCYQYLRIQYFDEFMESFMKKAFLLFSKINPMDCIYTEGKSMLFY